jgi:multidrug efflux pump subunit AcrA (membrane-fusion protein)
LRGKSSQPGYFVFVAKDSVIATKKDSAAMKKGGSAAKADSASNKPRLVASQVKVQVGQTIGPNIIIKGGLKAGQRIVVDGVQLLHDGAPVTTANKVGPGGGGKGGH